MSSVNQLTEYLDLAGDKFSIFCGSFVSALDDVAPTVPAVRLQLFTELNNVIKEGDDRIATEISCQIVNILNGVNIKSTFLDPDAFVAGIQRIKFEEMMRRLGELHDSKMFIDDIVNAIFCPEETGYNVNHMAVAHLLARGQCHCVFTTNFDTAIENSCRSIGYVPTVVTLRNAASVTLDNLKGKIFKLHGCASIGDVVANSTTFYRILGEKHFSVLTEAISKWPCLFFGYSGYGDVDISPHIRHTTNLSNIVWSNHLETGNPFPSSKTVVSDLMTRDHSKNFLLGLASKFGANLRQTKAGNNSKEKLAEFLRSDCTPTYAVDAFMDLAALYNPHINALFWYARGRSNFVRYEAAIAKDPRLLSIPLNQQCKQEIMQYGITSTYAAVWCPFIEWRLGSSAIALEQIEDAIESFNDNLVDDRIAAIKAINIGLSIIAEELWCCAPRARDDLAQRKKKFLERVAHWVAKPWWDAIESVDEAIAREKRLIEINYLLRRDIHHARAEVERLFELCVNLELFVRLIGLIHTAWLLDRRFGNNLFRKSSNSRVPSSLLMSVKKRNFSHWFYNTPIVGRHVYRFLERVFPRMVEKLYNFWFSCIGRGVTRRYRHLISKG